MKSPVQILVAFAMVFPAVLCIGFVSAQEAEEKPGEESLLRFIEIGGVAEFTLSRKQSSEGETSTSTAAEQLEMGVGIEPHAWIGSEFGWIHEHEEDHGEEEEGHDLGIFTGTIIVGPPDGRWWLKGGVQFLPFTLFEVAEVHAVHDASIGPLETGAIVDPLSFEFGSKREKSLLLGVSLGEFLGSVYGYYGDDARSDEPRSGFGAAVGYKRQVDEEEEIAFNLSYIDDLGTLAGLQEGVFGHEIEEHDEEQGADHGGLSAGDDERVPGWSVATAVRYSGVAFAAEYMISQDRYPPGVLAFDGRGARPAAWSLEAGYGFELAGRGGELTLGYQGTSEAAGLGIPSIRYLSVVTATYGRKRSSARLNGSTTGNTEQPGAAAARTRTNTPCSWASNSEQRKSRFRFRRPRSAHGDSITEGRGRNVPFVEGQSQAGQAFGVSPGKDGFAGARFVQHAADAPVEEGLRRKHHADPVRVSPAPLEHPVAFESAVNQDHILPLSESITGLLNKR